MRILLITLFSISLLGCHKDTTDNGHGRMCTYTCGNATLKAQISGTKEELDTIRVNTYSLNSNFTGDPLDTKYYYNAPDNIRFEEGKEYQLIKASDTFRITSILFAETRQQYILCADHCTVEATAVTVNGVTQQPGLRDRDLYIFQIK